MSIFCDSIEYVAVQCGGCGVPFAFSRAFYDKRKQDHKTWHCPNGCVRHYTGPSEVETLRSEVERQKQMREAEESRRLRVEAERDQVARAHNRMRVRVMNGVCPCCNRTFQNLMAHMKTEHAGEFNLRTLRTAFGMTQGALAQEIGVTGAYVSLHERGNPVPAYAKRAIESWIDQQAVKPKEPNA
jgi:DNA-binding XRE family transcriptional regulator